MLVINKFAFHYAPEALHWGIIIKITLYFSAADVVVLPYYEVTQSGVLHIAYAFGKPVVATWWIQGSRG